MSLIEAISARTLGRIKLQASEEMQHRETWCSSKAHAFIKQHDLFNEFGITKESDQYLLHGFTYKKVLQYHAEALAHLGRDKDAGYLTLVAEKTDRDLRKKINEDYLNPNDKIKARNIELALGLFFNMVTWEIRGQQGFATAITPEMLDYWRASWSGKI